MDNQKNMTYLIDMVKQIHETTLSLDQKIDARCDALDTKCDSLDAKIDKYYEENRKEHFEMRNMLAHIQNDIKDLRTDIDTVYDLEKDSRKQLRKLF